MSTPRSAQAAITRIVASPGHSPASVAVARATHHAKAGARITMSWGRRCGDAASDRAAAPASDASSAPGRPRERAPSTPQPASAMSAPAMPMIIAALPLPAQEATKPGIPRVLAPGVLPAAKPRADTKPAMPPGPTSASDTAATSAHPAAAPPSARQSRRASSQMPSPIARCGLVAAKASASQNPAARGRSLRQAA